jgi:DNA modification methylase
MIEAADIRTPESVATAERKCDSLRRFVQGHLSATLYLGCCLEIAPTLQGVDAVISDPPYGIGYCKGSGGKGKHNRRNIEKIQGDDKPFDPAVWMEYENVLLWGADHYAQRLPRGRWLVWDKLNGLPSFDSFSDIEVAWHNRTGAARIYHYMWKGICQQGDKEGGRVHPTQKPVPLMAWCMEQACVPIGATVLDPFMGSGTTGIACLRTGRNFVGIEKDPAHFANAVSRLEREANQGALL